MKDKEQLKVAWENFMFHHQLDPNLNELVKQSWIRSISYKVDCLQSEGPVVIPSGKLAEIVREKQDLLAISLPLMESLYSFVKGSGFLVILCDENGHLLKVIGDETTLRQAEEIRFVEGADWSEEVMGTNAIGTCIKVDQPIQIYAAEHFSRICQSWTCSASPIHDSEGSIIGVLNMSGPFEKVHPHTLGMIVSAVEAIENQLLLIEKAQKNETMQSYLKATMNNLTDGVLIVNREGVIIKTNEVFLQMVKLSEEEVVGRRIDQFFDNRSIRSIIGCETQVSNKVISLKSADNGDKVHVLLNLQPIHGPRGQLMGSLITVNEIKKVRRLICNLSGSQPKVTFADIIGQSYEFIKCKADAELAAQSEITVLLMGESGTGKDLFAQAIHNESERRLQPFIAINCGAISRDLLGSELFGYEEGAFTGAKKGGSAGKFELADGGTLFLDEIGEMSLEMQILLLRVLQNKEVTRIGGHQVIPVNVRIVAATNKDLEAEVRKGNFRRDLFYRLNVMPIKIPSLRNRKQDLDPLIHYFTDWFNNRLHKRITRISPQLLKILAEYDWPGNVRELQNVLERMIIRSVGSELGLEHLPEELIAMQGADDFAAPLRMKEEIKKQALIQSIREHNGNYQKAARHLGISRSTLYRQLKKFDLR